MSMFHPQDRPHVFVAASLNQRLNTFNQHSTLMFNVYTQCSGQVPSFEKSMLDTQWQSTWHCA